MERFEAIAKQLEQLRTQETEQGITLDMIDPIL
jgi:hypothetical protein